MEFTQDKRETDPLLTSVLDGNWPSGCLFLEHILTTVFLWAKHEQENC